MKFNTLIPELTVSDINKSKDFYINVLQFEVEYERPENNFVFISREGNQLMLKQDNGHWRTGDLVYPYGRGVNFEMTVFDVASLYHRVLQSGIRPFCELRENHYQNNDERISQNEFLIQDPDGYLVRFTD